MTSSIKDTSNVTLTEPIQAVTESMVKHLDIPYDISCSIRCSECNNRVTFVDPARNTTISRHDVGRFTCPYCDSRTTMRDCEMTERINCRTSMLGAKHD